MTKAIISHPVRGEMIKTDSGERYELLFGFIMTRFLHKFCIYIHEYIIKRSFPFFSTSAAETCCRQWVCVRVYFLLNVVFSGLPVYLITCLFFTASFEGGVEKRINSDDFRIDDDKVFMALKNNQSPPK
jgi:hypothetical protein